MSRPARRNPLIAVLTGLALVLAFAAGAAAQEYAAADWRLETADGGEVSFHEALADGPVVLSFWATWCRPCLKEMPRLDEMAGRFAGQVTFLAVNTDNSRAVAKVAPFIESAGLANLRVPMDTGGQVQQQLQVGGVLPFVALYDGRGREVYRHVGYKEGDELELEHAIAQLLSAPAAAEAEAAGKPAWAEAVTATDRFEYSYSTETKKEIFENWLDVSYQFGGFRTGVMLDSRAPSEEGDRSNSIRQRFFEFSTGEFDVRAGHFYGIFGRGLVFNAYEDRTVRVDTRLDGVISTVRHGGLTATAFSGTPSARALDIRAADAEYEVLEGLNLGWTGMTWRPDDWTGSDGSVRREWVTAVRARQKLDFLDWYAEYGWKKGWDYDPNDDDYDEGKALYANVNLYRGPVSLSWEHSDYERFTVVPRADGTTPLNRPPSLTREFAWTLLNRSPHPMNQDDETGDNLDAMYAGGGWTVIGSLAHLERQTGETVYELAYASVQKDRIGDFRLQGGFGYQDKEGLRQTLVGEATWFVDETRSLTLQAEHQHVRLGGGTGFDLGAYDEQWLKLEYETAPTWAFAAILEVNNKYDEQRPTGEQEGPFPAGQVTYTLSGGGNLNVWFGKRQAGYLCSGGVCKYEPAFEGVEFFGVFRY
jgi:cytochrome c biogenesis protein CcmG/thiol:disulfide interchange protein DsbE